MMSKNFNFDNPKPRKGDKSIKYGCGIPVIRDDEKMIPMWVADMDFEIMDEIKEALIERTKQGVFGYEGADDEFLESGMSWMERRHGWRPEKEWCVSVSGVVQAIRLAVQAFTKPGDNIAVFTPVYHPFYAAVEENGRNCIHIPLKQEEGRYVMDLELLEKKARETDIAMVILCSPHNPVGRVWSREELRQLGDICLEHDILLFSDEIHMDFCRHGVHVPFLKACPAMKDLTIVATAPSKTFNLAGLQASLVFIPNEKMRKAFLAAMERNGSEPSNVLGKTAAQAAWTYGDEWVDALNDYVEDNVQQAVRFIREKLPQIHVEVPEGTYLLWLDFRDLFGTDDEALEDFLLHKAHLYLNMGKIFGSEGSGFARMNLGCTHETLKQALSQLEEAVQSL